MRGAGRSRDHRARIKELESRVASLSIQVIDPTLKVRIWKRAALMTGVFWAVLCVLALVYLGPRLWGP